MSYEPKVYRKQGGNELVVASGGQLTVESGGVVEVAGADISAELALLSGLTADATELNKLDGAGAVVASGTTATHIADPSGGTTQDAEARAAIAAILDALEAFGIVAAS